MNLLLPFFILLTCIDMLNTEAPNPSSSASDHLSLLSFKSLISYDPSGALDSWNDSLPFCKWQGVTCGRRHPERVTALDLESLGLAGPISPSLGNLTFLRRLHIASNRLHGRIPLELGQLFRLQHVNLSFNDLEGGIPETLSHCSQLRVLSLRDNNLQGEIPSNISNCRELQLISLSNNMLGGGIPAELGLLLNLKGLIIANSTLTGGIPDSLGNLTSLVVLDLKRNNLTGNIPPSLANLSSLSYLSFAINALTGGIPPFLGRISSLTVLQLPRNSLSGPIPPSLGELSSLTDLTLSHNKLSGTIPSSLYNVSSIIYLDVADNHLFGALPVDLGLRLPNLQGIHVYSNRFEGPIPASLCNATSLEDIAFSDNNFSGAVPANMGALRSLTWLMLDRNQLTADGWIFVSDLTNCSRLQILQLHSNKLGGMLPSTLANLSTHLKWLSLEFNGISGSIPAEIGNLISLATIYMDSNFLTGSIPFSIGRLRRLQTLSLRGNLISVEIPSSIGNLTQLNSLYLSGNGIRGSIPASLGNCQALDLIDLAFNNLTGFIPREVVSISSLSSYFDVSYNSLTGPLPEDVGSLKYLTEFDVSGNQLSGEIPSSLSGCQLLEILNMDGNSFRGTIPPSLVNLKVIQDLDLSRNNLSGNIPEFLGGFILLTYLNLSFNNFEGYVPRDGVFGNVSAFSVLGNNKLCGGNPELHLPPCPVKASGQKHKFPTLKVIAPVIGAVLCFILVLLYFTRKSRKISRLTASPKDQYVKISYAELLKATNGFSSANLVGVGSFGCVYKGVMEDDVNGNEKPFAVKVLNLQQRGASKSFVAECEALRNARHRNLVKILNACSSVDFRGNDFKALVFEFMPNGSLENWLHPPESNSVDLDFIQRLNIAIDVASALEYLHHRCHTTIIHCDLKPSNILLDDDMTALVGDFGLARLLSEPASQSSVTATCSIVLRGSIGYVAPEYGMGGGVSTQGDVYSYGILLLELFTGKRPTDEEFEDGLSLHKFVATAFPVRVMDVIDPRLLSKEDEMASNDGDRLSNARGRMRACLVLVIGVGLSCSKESPRERMRMEDIVKDMYIARDTFLGVG